MSDIPLGWSENPSAWSRRLPIIGGAVAGLGIALYAAFFQPTSTFWSTGMKWPEMALAAGGFGIVLLGLTLGGAQRWRSVPGLVVAAGVCATLLAVFNLYMAALQFIRLEHWSVLWLGLALLSASITGPLLEETLAGLQCLKRAKHARPSLWQSLRAWSWKLQAKE